MGASDGAIDSYLATLETTQRAHWVNYANNA